MVDMYKPKTLIEALEIMNDKECTVFAGGTDLMVKKKQWSGIEPEFEGPVVFISDLPELKEINTDENILRIGAACTCSEIIENKSTPGFIRNIFLEMASPAIRNLATIGGNICNSSPAGDSLPLLYALDSVLVLHSIEGIRDVPVEEFIMGPSKNILKHNEILKEIKINLGGFNVIDYKKVGTRKSIALSKLSFIGFAKVSEKILEDIRLAFGAVGPTVVRNRDMEKQIVSMYKDSNKIDSGKIREMYGAIIKPIDDQRSTAFYRKETCLRLLENFILKLSQ